MIDSIVQYFDILHEDWKEISIWRNVRSLYKFLAITTQIWEIFKLVTKLHYDNAVPEHISQSSAGLMSDA